MPPANNRKRRNDDISDHEGVPAQPAAKKPRKMTQAEKAEARERARRAMLAPKTKAATPAVPAVPAAAMSTKQTKAQQDKIREKVRLDFEKKSPATTTSTAAPSTAARRSYAGTRKTSNLAAGKKTRKTNTDTIGAPPAWYPDPIATATGQETNEQTNNLIPGGAAFSVQGNTTPTPIPPSTLPPVRFGLADEIQPLDPVHEEEEKVEIQPAQPAVDDAKKDAVESEPQTFVDRAYGLFASKKFQRCATVLSVLCLAVDHTLGYNLLRRAVAPFNPFAFKSGIFMVVGSTRIPYEHVHLGGDMSVADVPEDVLVPEPTRICYHESPEEILKLVNEENLADSYAKPNDCAMTIPCPENAICFQGSLVDCQGPVWQLKESFDEEKEPTEAPLCILSKKVNDTYQEIVSLVESWSIKHVCFDEKDGIAPLSFYEQDATDPTELVISVADQDTNPGVPLYEWSLLQREGFESLQAWDFEQLKTVNQFHQKLVLHDGSSVGLSKNEFLDAQSNNKLTWSCRGYRTYRNNRLCTLLFLFGCAVLGIYRICAAVKQRREDRIHKIRRMVLSRLQAKAPTKVASLHLRDDICDELYGNPNSKESKEFRKTIWPWVQFHIRRDNRVGKGESVVDRNKREEWWWATSL